MRAKHYSLLLAAVLLIGTLTMLPPLRASSTATVRVIPSPIDLGVGHVDVTGTEFTVAVVVEDVENLYGLSVKVYINETYFEYVSHTTTIPVEDYPDPIDPSPYPGILHAEVVAAKDEYDPDTHILEVAYSSKAPAPAFTGSGTVCTITLRLKYQPFDYEIPGEFIPVEIELTEVKLADNSVPPQAIPYTPYDGVVNVYWRPFTYPPLPALELRPSTYTASAQYETFNYDVYLLGEGGTDLDSFWDVAGFDIYVRFDPSLIEAVDVAIDPDGWFASFWPGGVVEAFTPILNNTEGYVRFGFVGIPATGGVHSPPYGVGRIATITFNATYLHLGYPPPSCVVGLKNPEPRPSIGSWGPEYFSVDIAGFPHPERTMDPWNGAPYSVPIPHVVVNASYTAPYRVLGPQIDLYTQYPYPHGGQEPNKPSDMFVPQQEVVLFAKVTYNLWPEQNKDVSFQVIDPYGDTYFIGCNRTNSDGIAMYRFRLPWKCDDPEYYFGTWTVIATTEVAEQVITDTMQFKYDYLVHIWKTVTDKTEYEHGEYITVTIDYGSAATQTYNVIIGVVVKDETGVPFDWDYTQVTVGGAEWCTYANGTVSLTLYIPKWARSGQATLEVTVLTDFPMNGGTQVYPTDPEHNTVITFGIKIPV